MRTNDEIMDIFEKLKEEQDLSISEIARRSGMAKSAISRYFNRSREFPLNRVNDFAKIFHVSPEYILGIGSDGNNKLINLYNRLTDTNKGKVYSYTESLLDKQDNVIGYPHVEEQVALYGSVSAGTGEALDDEQVEYIDYDKAIPEHDFALRVNGNSMEPTLQDNEIIFIKKAIEPEYNGQIVIAILNGNGYVKKYYEDGPDVRLISLNSEYEDIVIHEYDDLQIKGIVIL